MKNICAFIMVMVCAGCTTMENNNKQQQITENDLQVSKIHPLQPVFVNGCLEMILIESRNIFEEEKLKNADVNNDNCISIEEYKTVKNKIYKHTY